MKQLAIVLLFCFGLRGQAFEVTLVKPHGPAVPGAQRVSPTCKDGRFMVLGFGPLHGVIVWAYDLKDSISIIELGTKLPMWARTVAGSYDLEATYTGEVSEDQCRKMVRNLLAERFKFTSHWETGTGAVYNLVVARGGLKMPKVQNSDQSRGIYITMNGRLGQYSPFAPVPQGLTMDNLSKLLEGGLNPLDRIPVINKTGLEGLYKITLTFSQGAAADQAFADPELFTAIQQQLGLKLEKGQGPVSHFIVDHIEMPSEN